MPTHKAITCTISSAVTNKPFPEHGTKFDDNRVTTYIIAPTIRPTDPGWRPPNTMVPSPTAFTIHVTSSEFIASGLAVFVFIDGHYQCNRNRRNLVPHAPGRKKVESTVDFLLRRKEEWVPKRQWIGKEWRFEELRYGEPVPRPYVPVTNLDHLGIIEVVVLRLRDPPLPSEPVRFIDAFGVPFQMSYICEYGLGGIAGFDGAGDPRPHERLLTSKRDETKGGRRTGRITGLSGTAEPDNYGDASNDRKLRSNEGPPKNKVSDRGVERTNSPDVIGPRRADRNRAGPNLSARQIRNNDISFNTDGAAHVRRESPSSYRNSHDYYLLDWQARKTSEEINSDSGDYGNSVAEHQRRQSRGRTRYRSNIKTDRLRDGYQNDGGRSTTRPSYGYYDIPQGRYGGNQPADLENKGYPYEDANLEISDHNANSGPNSQSEYPDRLYNYGRDARPEHPESPRGFAHMRALSPHRRFAPPSSRRYEDVPYPGLPTHSRHADSAWAYGHTRTGTPFRHFETPVPGYDRDDGPPQNVRHSNRHMSRPSHGNHEANSSYRNTSGDNSGRDRNGRTTHRESYDHRKDSDHQCHDDQNLNRLQYDEYWGGVLQNIDHSKPLRRERGLSNAAQIGTQYDRREDAERTEHNNGFSPQRRGVSPDRQGHRTGSRDRAVNRHIHGRPVNQPNRPLGDWSQYQREHRSPSSCRKRHGHANHRQGLNRSNSRGDDRGRGQNDRIVDADRWNSDTVKDNQNISNTGTGISKSGSQKDDGSKNKSRTGSRPTFRGRHRQLNEDNLRPGAVQINLNFGDNRIHPNADAHHSQNRLETSRADPWSNNGKNDAISYLKAKNGTEDSGRKAPTSKKGESDSKIDLTGKDSSGRPEPKAGHEKAKSPNPNHGTRNPNDSRSNKKGSVHGEHRSNRNSNLYQGNDGGGPSQQENPTASNIANDSWGSSNDTGKAAGGDQADGGYGNNYTSGGDWGRENVDVSHNIPGAWNSSGVENQNHNAGDWGASNGKQNDAGHWDSGWNNDGGGRDYANANANDNGNGNDQGASDNYHHDPYNTVGNWSGNENNFGDSANQNFNDADAWNENANAKKKGGDLNDDGKDNKSKKGDDWNSSGKNKNNLTRGQTGKSQVGGKGGSRRGVSKGSSTLVTNPRKDKDSWSTPNDSWGKVNVDNWTKGSTGKTSNGNPKSNVNTGGDDWGCAVTDTFKNDQNGQVANNDWGHDGNDNCGTGNPGNPNDTNNVNDEWGTPNNGNTTDSNANNASNNWTNDNNVTNKANDGTNGWNQPPAQTEDIAMTGDTRHTCVDTPTNDQTRPIQPFPNVVEQRAASVHFSPFVPPTLAIPTFHGPQAHWNAPAGTPVPLYPPIPVVGCNPPLWAPMLGPRLPSGLRRRPKSYPYLGEEQPRYVVHKDTVRHRSPLSHQVQPGKPAYWIHQVYKPSYLDTFHEPYAVFKFKYRSKEVIDFILQSQAEAEKQHLLSMPKEQLVEEVLKMKAPAARSSGDVLPTESATEWAPGNGSEDRRFNFRNTGIDPQVVGGLAQWFPV